MMAMRGRGPVNPALAALERRKGGPPTDPDAAGHLRMNADNEMYAAPKTDPLKAAMGMGHMDLSYLQRPTTGRAGDDTYKQHLGMMARHGVEMGPVWDEITDLNRARRATGMREYDPVGELAGAGRQGAAMQERINAGAIDDGLRADALEQGSRAYTNLLDTKGVDTEKAAYELGPQWQRSPALDQYQWGEPQSAALSRRPARRPAGGSRALR